MEGNACQRHFRHGLKTRARRPRRLGQSCFARSLPVEAPSASTAAPRPQAAWRAQRRLRARVFNPWLPLLALPLLTSLSHADSPPTPTFPAGPTLSVGRWAPTAVVLADGRVLVAGGYDYAQKNTVRSADLLAKGRRGRWKVEPTGALVHDRNFAVAALLPDGMALVAGGYSEHCDSLDIAERFDPRTRTWSETKGFLHDHRELFTLTPLADGRLLLVGGLSLERRHTLASAEIYDPRTDEFTETAGPMADERFGQAAVRLADGRVLIVGGKSWKIGQPDHPVMSAAVFDAQTDKFTPTAGSLIAARDRPTASLLPDGRVLIAGGANGSETPTACEIWDPQTGRFSDAGAPLAEGRMAHAAVTLPDGRVVVAGGWSGARKASTPTVEVYDPQANAWSRLPDLPFASLDLCLVLLPDGRLLAIAGKATVGGDEKTASSVAQTAFITVPSR